MNDSGRVEHDTMGEMRVPTGAFYGAQTARAIENFPISGARFPRAFLHALGLIKSAAATVNGRQGHLPAELALRIAAAADRVAAGEYDNQFVVDIFQTGSGTSTNMNANEVIGRLAGAHPNDDVNRGQSSNDVIPTAIHVAAAVEAHGRLLPALAGLQGSLARKAGELADVIKIGRTHLQDAVPMRMGQEFSGYARQVEAARGRILQALEGIYELPLGGTAVGTGLNAPPGFADAVIAELARRTGLPFIEARNHFEAQAARDAVCFLSGALRTCAVGLTKIANDIRWLASGPRCGIGEIRLPEVPTGLQHHAGQGEPRDRRKPAHGMRAGGGVRCRYCLVRRGGHFRAEPSSMPVMAPHDLLTSIALARPPPRAHFQAKLVDGLEADRDRAEGLLVDAYPSPWFRRVAPEIGYEKAAALAKEAYRTRRTRAGGRARAGRHSGGAPKRTAGPPAAGGRLISVLRRFPPQTRMILSCSNSTVPPC